jgi:hypothetical protein
MRFSDALLYFLGADGLVIAKNYLPLHKHNP